MTVSIKDLKYKVAHLDYYSNDKLTADNFRVAPENSAAYTRPPRIILVELEMSRKDVRKLLEENEQYSDDMEISIEVEHVSDLRYKGKIVPHEDESEAEISQGYAFRDFRKSRSRNNLKNIEKSNGRYTAKI